MQCTQLIEKRVGPLDKCSREAVYAIEVKDTGRVMDYLCPQHTAKVREILASHLVIVPLVD